MNENHFMRERLEAKGISPTPQRLSVATVLLDRPQHMTAEQVHDGIRRIGERVSVATVYNTLKLFSQRGLVREVVVEPGRVFYDSTAHPHHHLYNEDTGELTDIPSEQVAFSRLPDLPAHLEASAVQVIVRTRAKKDH